MLKKKGKTKVLTIQSGAKAICGCLHHCYCTSVSVTREHNTSYNVNLANAEYGIEWS